RTTTCRVSSNSAWPSSSITTTRGVTTKASTICRPPTSTSVAVKPFSIGGPRSGSRPSSNVAGCTTQLQPQPQPRCARSSLKSIADLSNRIYAITPTQIYARTFVPLKIIGLGRWLLPVPKHPALVDEELAQKKDLDHLSVQARQELEVDGLPAVRTWHADFHRTVDPDRRFVTASGTGFSL